MKRYLVLVVLSLAALLGNLAWAGSAREDSTERLQNSADVLKQIAAAPDKGIPEEVLKNSKCIVVVPHLVKAGFIVGAKHGPESLCAVPVQDGARLPSLASAEEAGACRSARRVWTW
jgi:lipid-binding SYLF domain-containing protein